VLSWVARFAVLGVATPAVLLAGAYSREPLGSWWLELLQYVPYPAFLLPALLAVVLSWRLGWGWRLIAIGALGLVVTIIMGFVFGHADAGSDALRMMTYNIKAMRAHSQPGVFEALEREVARHRPDLLVMQDAGELTAARHKAPAIAQSIFAGRNVFSHDQYIVVSRYPLRDCRAGDLSFRGQPHSYVHCIVAVDGNEIELFTAHLLSPRYGINAARHEGAEGIDDWQRNFEDRLSQSRTLAREVALRDRRPLIVAGDLNAPETSPVIRTLLDRGLRDAFSSAGRGYGYTHGHSTKLMFSFLRIDHILVSPEIGVVDAFAGGRDGSEHRPVIAELLLKRDDPR
jgi:vancomycin resistance protein VanJ